MKKKNKQTKKKKTRSYTIADKCSSGKPKKANIAVHSCWHKCDDFDSGTICTKLGKSHSSLYIFFFCTNVFLTINNDPTFSSSLIDSNPNDD